MKKLSYYTMSLLLLCGLSACVEDSELPAPPQSWEQDAAKEGTSFTASAVQPIVLADVTSDSVALCSFTAPAGVEGSVSYEIRLDDQLTLELDEKARVAKSDLQNAIIELYGKRPEARTIKAVTTAFADNDGQVTRLEAPQIDLIATPEAPFIDKAYYLVGDMCGWDAEKMLQFSHSGKDVYEDPIFSIIVKTTGDNYWKVIPQGNIDSNNFWYEGETGVLGVAENGSTDSEGKLVTEKPQAAKVEDAGFVRITLDMMEYTYKVEAFNGSPFLYVPGDHQGWSPATAPYLYSTDMMSYQAYITLNKEFKLAPERGWDGAYGIDADNKLSTSGDNISVETPGFYLLKASLADMSWSADLIDSYGLIGDATEGGWDNSTPMAFDAATSTYTVTATLKDGSFKFRANNGWDINLGGDLSNLTSGGDNIAVTAGTYLITLNLSDPAKYSATMVKQ